jgi:hypothetical protein
VIERNRACLLSLIAGCLMIAPAQASAAAHGPELIATGSAVMVPSESRTVGPAAEPDGTGAHPPESVDTHRYRPDREMPRPGIPIGRDTLGRLKQSPPPADGSAVPGVPAIPGVGDER